MQFWIAHPLIGCEPQSDLHFEGFFKVNSTLRSPKQVKFAPSRKRQNRTSSCSFVPYQMNADVIKRQRRVCFAQIPVTRRWPAELVKLTFCCPSKSTRPMHRDGWEPTSSALLAPQPRLFCRKGLSVLNVQRMSLATWR